MTEVTPDELSEDDCALCEGTGEIDATHIQQHGSQPCPSCVSRECAQLRAECADKALEIDRLRGELQRAQAALDGAFL